MVFIIGWGLAYGPGGNLFCGASQFFCWQLEYDQYPTWLFQVTNDVGGEHDIVYIYIMMAQLAKIIELIMMATLLNATYAMQSCVLKTWEMTLRLEVVSQVFRVTIGHGGDVIHINLDNRHASSSSLPPPPPRWSPGQSQRGPSSPPISSTGLQTYT